MCWNFNEALKNYESSHFWDSRTSEISSGRIREPRRVNFSRRSSLKLGMIDRNRIKHEWALSLQVKNSNLSVFTYRPIGVNREIKGRMSISTNSELPPIVRSSSVLRSHGKGSGGMYCRFQLKANTEPELVEL
ncbi:hypothetical protein EVAR_92440_1 [Eumeta japonica]|uniref:Uncharacterized protein n=1 Tax=Eumeta variegata TaxID=151549 RepID=A0A4C1T5Y4_EUMVA|nr:hypothetical protein EVAR_92440_1 [Eumeta japonica]